MSHVFHRATQPRLAVHAEGCWIYDQAGNAYLDAAGGALVNTIGHGDPDVISAMANQAGDLDYVHASAFTTRPLEEYAAALAPYLPLEVPRVYPTSGGSEATETAIKLARAYHIARGEHGRDVILSRHMSYHGNTLGALDLSGREPLRRPYESWLGRFPKVPEVTEYRCPAPDHPRGCAEWHMTRLEKTIVEIGPERVAAFIAEPIGGATLGATVPPAGYWQGIADICARHGILLMVDEVMTGFGRTGRWFGIDHFGVHPDILIAAKGAASGYWPLGLCVASGSIHETVEGGFIHGFTFSHFPTGAAVGHAVLDRLLRDDLVAAADTKGERLRNDLQARLAGCPVVGDVRGIGMMTAVELVSEAVTKSPFPRSKRVAERLTDSALDRGLLVYPSTGCADGIDGDLVMIGPPFIISDEELDMIGERLEAAIGDIG